MFYFKQMDDSNIISVESKTVNVPSLNFIEATKEEYDGYIASLPEPPEPPEPRDFGAEIDEIKAKLIVSEPGTGEVKITNLTYNPTTKEIHHRETP